MHLGSPSSALARKTLSEKGGGGVVCIPSLSFLGGREGAKNEWNGRVCGYGFGYGMDGREVKSTLYLSYHLSTKRGSVLGPKGLVERSCRRHRVVSGVCCLSVMAALQYSYEFRVPSSEF